MGITAATAAAIAAGASVVGTGATLYTSYASSKKAEKAQEEAQWASYYAKKQEEERAKKIFESQRPETEEQATVQFGTDDDDEYTSAYAEFITPMSNKAPSVATLGFNTGSIGGLV
jgi:siroheme synthase